MRKKTRKMKRRRQRKRTMKFIGLGTTTTGAGSGRAATFQILSRASSRATMQAVSTRQMVLPIRMLPRPPHNRFHTGRGLRNVPGYAVDFMEVMLADFGIPVVGLQLFIIMLLEDCSGHEEFNDAMRLTRLLSSKMPRALL